MQPYPQIALSRYLSFKTQRIGFIYTSTMQTYSLLTSRSCNEETKHNFHWNFRFNRDVAVVISKTYSCNAIMLIPKHIICAWCVQNRLLTPRIKKRRHRGATFVCIKAKMWSRRYRNYKTVAFFAQTLKDIYKRQRPFHLAVFKSRGIARRYKRT